MNAFYLLIDTLSQCVVFWTVKFSAVLVKVECCIGKIMCCTDKIMCCIGKSKVLFVGILLLVDNTSCKYVHARARMHMYGRIYLDANMFQESCLTVCVFVCRVSGV